RCRGRVQPAVARCGWFGGFHPPYVHPRTVPAVLSPRCRGRVQPAVARCGWFGGFHPPYVHPRTVLAVLSPRCRGVGATRRVLGAVGLAGFTRPTSTRAPRLPFCRGVP